MAQVAVVLRTMLLAVEGLEELEELEWEEVEGLEVEEARRVTREDSRMKAATSSTRERLLRPRRRVGFMSVRKRVH